MSSVLQQAVDGEKYNPLMAPTWLNIRSWASSLVYTACFPEDRQSVHNTGLGYRDVEPRIEKMALVALDGWKKNETGDYEKLFVNGDFRQLAEGTLKILAGGARKEYTFEDLKGSEEPGEPMMGTTPTKYKLTVKGDLFEAVYLQEEPFLQPLKDKEPKIAK